MVGNAQSKYIHNNPSLCEVYNETTGENTTSELYDCPAALDVVFTITFVTGLIMVREQLHVNQKFVNICMGRMYLYGPSPLLHSCYTV